MILSSKYIGAICKSLIIKVFMFCIWQLLDIKFDGKVWDGLQVSQSAITGEYCEKDNTAKLFHQSSNSYSNLAYFFVGIFILIISSASFGRKNPIVKNRLENFPALSYLMGICFIYLCFGSAFFHASLTWISQRVDMNGTFGLSICLLFMGIYHVFHKIDYSKTAKNLIIITILVCIGAFYFIHLYISSSILLPVLILGNFAFMIIHFFQFKSNKFWILPLAGFLIMLLAIKIRSMDVHKINCDPNSWLQGHAIWHILTAISSFSSYAFYRFSK